MKKPDIQQLYQAGSYLICVFLALQITSGLEGTEFSGRVADRSAALNGGHRNCSLHRLFCPNVCVPAATIGLASSVLCLPLYLFFIAPVPFAQVFARGHEFKDQPTPGSHWHMWPVIGLLALAVTLYSCIRRAADTNQKQIPHRT